MTKQELFTKVTGLTWDVEKLANMSDEKKKWLIPDGVILENAEGLKFKLTKEFAEEIGIDINDKVSTAEIVETLDHEPTAEDGEGWVKVIDVPASEAVEAHEAYYRIVGDETNTEYAEDPTYEVFNNYEFINDETSWNASYANGTLKVYYEKYPEEDCWNNTQNRACNYNDRVYEGTIDEAEVTANATWASEAAQKITIDGVDYYGAIFYGFEPQNVALFNDVALTESADKTLVITSIHYSAECGQSWNGAVNAPGAALPWAWIGFNYAGDVNAKVIWRYEGAEDIKPWDDELFGANGTKQYGWESVTKKYGAEFDINKFQMVLEKQIEVEFVEAVEAKDAVEEQAHWERKVIKIND